jgi:outer membrane receptor protein involved in Fe transport
MAGDPPLDQVVAKTYEVGTRGKFSDLIGWSASAYQTKNHNDIQFIAANTNGEGYFDNISRTKRSGLDVGLNGQYDKLRWFANYSYVRAQYDTEFEMPAEYNSSAVNGNITVKKGDTLPGVPQHQLKLRAQYSVTPSWTVGTNVIGFSDRYLRGNENNDHATVTNSQTRQNADENVNEGPGKLAGYFTVNLDTTYNVGNGWKLYAKAINVFDRDYGTGGQFGFSHFTGNGLNFDREGLAYSFLAPGAPRAAWIGVRYEFGGAPEAK